MSKTYLPYEPDQQLLLPAALQEWLADDHLAYFMSDVVDQLDMSEVTARYERERRGGPPYHPRMMVKFGYATYLLLFAKGEHEQPGVPAERWYVEGAPRGPAGVREPDHRGRGHGAGHVGRVPGKRADGVAAGRDRVGRERHPAVHPHDGLVDHGADVRHVHGDIRGARRRC